MEVAELKKLAAERAVEFVESGMVVGMGHGSTAIFAVYRIGEMVRSGQLRDIRGVPCSIRVEEESRKMGIPLMTLDDCITIDLTIDGADEVDTRLDLIKGGGGALLREKIVAQASRREIIVVDESKLSPALGTRWAVPVEVALFGWRSQMCFLESLGARVSVRQNKDGTLFKTDQGNMILDCDFGAIHQPDELAEQLNSRSGIVEHGLFLGLATDVMVASQQGVRHLRREQ